MNNAQFIKCAISNQRVINLCHNTNQNKQIRAFSTIIEIYHSNFVFFYPKVTISFGTMSDSDEEAAEKQFKIFLVGDSGSGKTSLANCFASDSFTKNTVETVGVEFCLKTCATSNQPESD